MNASLNSNDDKTTTLLDADIHWPENDYLHARVYQIHVITGDRTGAGTDSNVSLLVNDVDGNPSRIINPETLFHNDHERASTTTIAIKATDLGIDPPFASISIWRDNACDIPSDILGRLSRFKFGGSKKGSSAWFLDRVEIELTANRADQKNQKNIFAQIKNNIRRLSLESLKNSRTSSESSIDGHTNMRYVFPVQRWIDANRIYHIELYDSVISHLDKRPEQRRKEMAAKRHNYRYKQNIHDGPMQAAKLPSDEKFSEDYYWTFVKDKARLLAKIRFTQLTTPKCKSMDELKNVTTNAMGETTAMSRWHTDEWFSLQRVQGVNPYLITLCQHIPQNFNVSEDDVSGLLENLTLAEALQKNKIFLCDLEILDNIPCKDNRKLASPLALFYLRSDDQLCPVAIQLSQQKGPQNPVFTPKDRPNTWLVAKMFYNNAEAQHHQGVSHLGLTHLLMEGVCLCTHRQLSPSHPIFKLIAPHFLFLIAINTRGLEKLISPGGWVDNCMTQGIDGIYEVIRRGLKRHRFVGYGNVKEEIKSRGVLDPNILPYYPYRDDAINIFDIIRKYVASVVHHHYDAEDKLLEDWELRDWRIELTTDREKGGVGLIDVPGDTNKGFRTVDELVETVTIIIATSSLGHAAANFQQYEQYGFVPNYPGILTKDPPTFKRDYSDEEVLDFIPNMKMTLETMVITKLLSNRGTNSLGDFEMQYLFHPTDVHAAEEFRKDLQKLSLEIQKRNIDRKLVFPWLDPSIIPNAISI